MEVGETREIAILPSLWYLRQTHRPHALVAGAIGKGEAETLEIGDTTYEAVPWRLVLGARARTVWTEVAYPHRILKWEDSDGGSGEWVKTIRMPYWQLQGTSDEFYRRELGIPH